MGLRKITKIFLLIFLLHILKVSSNDPSSLIGCNDCSTDSKCNNVDYCKDGSTIKIVNSGTPGSVKFGKSGTPTGNYFFSDGKLITDRSVAEAAVYQYTCSSSGCTLIDVPTTNMDFYTYINSKASALNCAYMKVVTDNTSSTSYTCQLGVSEQSYYDNAFKKVINCSSSKCTLTSAAGYYVNYDDSSSYIYCDGNTCNPKSVTANVFFLNAGLDKSSKPIIYCSFSSDSSSGSSSGTCETITGDTTVAYLEGKANKVNDSDYYNSLIICTSSTKCTSVVYDSGIFLNSEKGLIKCSSGGCTKLSEGYIEGDVNKFFVDELSKKLIRCISGTTSGTLTCELYTDTSNKYYLDYSTPSSSALCVVDTNAGSGNTSNNNGRRKRTDSIDICGVNIISCDSSSKCKSSLIVNESNFIDGDKSTNLIICSTFGEDFFCTILDATNLTYYYLNSGNTSDYPLLYCGDGTTTTTNKCVEKKASTNGYYMTDKGDINNEPYSLDNIGYLIHCSSETKCEKLSDIANNGYYVNAGYDNSKKPLILFESDANQISEVNTVTGDDYYLDSSSLVTNSYTNLIYCSSSKTCTSIAPNDGYYYNAPGDDQTDRVIKCDKTGCNTGENTEEPFQTCTTDSSMTLYVGNYCLQKDGNEEASDLNFVINDFTIDSEPIDSSNHNITYVTSGVKYYYLSVFSGNFPGISSTVNTLFEVKSNAITRVVDDAVYIINSKNERIESVSGSVSIGSTYSVYTCSSTTKTCMKKTSCPISTYLFDEANGKGYLCSEKSVIPITDEGYYVDGSYVVNKAYTPAVLKCNDSGDCERFIPTTNTYFLNAGVDNDTRALIHCSNDQCVTEEASIGYYRAEFGESGVIVCTSNTNCKISSLRYNYYINSGSDSYVKPIIACSKNVYCDTKKAVSGYYLVQESNNLLINCKTGISCEVEEASIGYYYNSANNDNTSGVETIIKCYSSQLNTIICKTEKKNEGFYMSGNENNVLINCMGSKCKSVIVENGIFRSAASVKTSVKNSSRDKYDEEDEDREGMGWIEHSGRNSNEIDELSKQSNVMLRMSEKNLFSRATSSSSDSVVSTLIICSGGVCSELTAEELSVIPVCTYGSDMCYLDNSNYSANSNKNNIVTSVAAGEYCTDNSRSTIYFATETIVEYNDVISGVLSTSKTTTKNCIKASSQYSSNLFTVGNNIYQVNDGFIKQVYDSGYYFINIKKNTLVYGTEIKEYNNSNVLLYKCDGASCRIMDKPTSNTFYTDVTKRILKYSVEEDKYSFINKKENICMFEDNTCTPKYDMGENDFCITAEGNIVVAGEKIKSRETGKCFMSYSISENVLAFSYNSVLYLLNSNAAKQVVTSGYYFAENNKYNSAEYKAFNTTTSGITLYGCINHNCGIYQPQPDIYYFDMLTNYLIQKKNDEWISPIKVGHLNVSISPEETYIYSYTMSDNKELLLTKTNKSGYYYTIDNKMYYCDVGVKTCKEIEDSAYILTNSNEFYYCVVDSEGEETECYKKSCTTGQIYYIKNDYYRCTTGSLLELVRSRTCDHDDVVVINFPLIYSDTFPIGVYNSISNIAKNNHYVPTQKTSRQSIESFQGVFTNCTYDAYDEDTTYDQICMQNYVKLNQDNEPDICNVKLLGYTYCTIEDGDNKDKCNPSGSLSQKTLSILQIMSIILSTIIYFIIY